MNFRHCTERNFDLLPPVDLRHGLRCGGGGSSSSTTASTNMPISATDSGQVGSEGGQVAKDQAVNVGEHAKVNTGVQTKGDYVTGLKVGGALNTGKQVTSSGTGNTINISDGAAEVGRLASKAADTIQNIVSAASADLNAVLEEQSQSTLAALDKAGQLKSADAAGTSDQTKVLFYAALVAMALGGIYLFTRK